MHQGRRATRGNRIRVRNGNSSISSAWPPEDPDDPESSVAHLRGVDHDWIMQDLYTCRYTHTLHMLHTMRTYWNRPTPTGIDCAAPNRVGQRTVHTLQGVRDQLTIPSRIGRHMREKGAAVGPDTFLAQTLISAVRLSGTTDGWEGAKRRVGCRRYMSEVPCGACSSGTCLRYISVLRGKAQGLARVCIRVGCINQAFSSVRPFDCYSPSARSILRTTGRTLIVALSRAHAATSSGKHRMPGHRMQAPGHALPHTGWGRGRILPLRIRATVNLASAVGPSSSHLQHFQTEKGPQTIQLPTSHD